MDWNFEYAERNWLEPDEWEDEDEYEQEMEEEYWERLYDLRKEEF